jgi:ABC-type lipoprotein release transport system permease subunit
MFKLAWRNLWRNRRRTLITAASVFFAVFLAILMRGFHSGSWTYLIDNVLHSYSGYVQVHTKGFWENKSFDYSINQHEKIFDDVRKLGEVKQLIPRIESFSLASAGEKTKGVITIGIDPEIEKGFSALNNKIVGGRFFSKSDTGIILSERLAKHLSTKVGDSLVLLGQGYQGASANGIFKIIGIVKLPSPEFDNQLVYMPLALAQKFFSMQNRLTSMVVDLEDPQEMDHTVSEISRIMDGNKYEVMSWEDMLVELYQQYVSDEGGGLIMLGLLYIIVGFGIFGTVLMMIAERRHEFGVMMAVGMKRNMLVRLVSAELFFICSIGLVAGMVASIPVVAYYHFHPIEMSGSMAEAYAVFGMEPVLPVAWRADYIIQQAINVGMIVLAALIYPVYNMYKLDLTKAIRR